MTRRTGRHTLAWKTSQVDGFAACVERCKHPGRGLQGLLREVHSQRVHLLRTQVHRDRAHHAIGTPAALRRELMQLMLQVAGVLLSQRRAHRVAAVAVDAVTAGADLLGDVCGIDGHALRAALRVGGRCEHGARRGDRQRELRRGGGDRIHLRLLSSSLCAAARLLRASAIARASVSEPRLPQALRM